MKRFASHSEEDIIAKRQNLFPTNTVKANKAASNLFRSYLKEKNMETNFEMFDVARLAETLPFLYGRAYKKLRSLQSHNINKHKTCFEQIFKEPPVPEKI
jgi:hypothetical protein